MKKYGIIEALVALVSTLSLGLYLAGISTFQIGHGFWWLYDNFICCCNTIFPLVILIFIIKEIVKPTSGVHPGERTCLFFLNLQFIGFATLNVSAEIWPIIWPKIPTVDRIFIGIFIWLAVAGCYLAIHFSEDVKNWNLAIAS